MLSKLRYFLNGSAEELRAEKARIDPVSIRSVLGTEFAHITPIAGGTLAAAFMASGEGRPRFLKTHLTEQGRANLKKEAVLLAHLYPSLQVETFEIEAEDTGRLWLIMDWLAGATAGMDTAAVLGVIEGYTRGLSDFRDPHLVEPSEDFGYLLNEGDRALADLAGRGLLGPAVQERVRECLALLQDRRGEFAPQLCHGDLSPVNIMSDGRRLLAIDWEDAFWGVAGYDYLFWLTFFQNRKYYSKEFLGHTPWGITTEIAIMVLILVLKSEISARSGSHVGNALTFDQRILEVLSIVS